MVARHGHFLRAPRFLGGGRAPALLARKDQDFLPALLEELRSDDGRARTGGTVAKTSDGADVLRLFQPVHRVFNLAVLEAFCDDFGSPRVDPKRVESAGLVVRRVVVEREGRKLAAPEVEGWLREGRTVVGWRRLNRGQQDADPDPERRRPPVRTGHPAVNALLRQSDLEWNLRGEAVSPLFTAPPDACADAGATVLYGIVPVTSSELVEDLPPAPLLPEGGAEGKALNAMVPGFLTPGTWRVPGNLRPDELPGDEEEQAAFFAFISDLARLRALGALEDAAFLAVLNAIPTRDPATGQARGPLGTVLVEAARVLESDEPRTPPPAGWTIGAGGSFHPDLRRVLRGAVDRTAERLTAGAGRFERAGALYHVRAFVRLRRCDGCPPELVWSDPSEPFRIVPWFEASDAPPVRVQLPEAKLSELAKLKPNVAFATPASVQDLLGGMQIKKPLEVKKGSLELGVDWICGFSIPLITLCAFIVLNIFLQLLNIIFWWLPFIKICIPIPRIRNSERL